MASLTNKQVDYEHGRGTDRERVPRFHMRAPQRHTEMQIVEHSNHPLTRAATAAEEEEEEYNWSEGRPPNRVAVQ